MALRVVRRNSFAVVSSLLYEVISVYAYLNGPVSSSPPGSPPGTGGGGGGQGSGSMGGPVLSMQHSNRVCNALALFQALASHPDTRKSLLTGTSAQAAPPSPIGPPITH